MPQSISNNATPNTNNVATLPSRVRSRMRSASNSAKVARMLKNISHRITRIVAALTECKRDAPSGKLIGVGARVWNGAGEPVQLRHYQRIAMPNCGKRLIETGPGTVRARQYVIEVNPVGSDT